MRLIQVTLVVDVEMYGEMDSTAEDVCMRAGLDTKAFIALEGEPYGVFNPKIVYTQEIKNEEI